jgi:hypothetical protein
LDGRARFVAFAAAAREAAESGGGRPQLVQLTAPVAVLEQRLADPSHQQLQKLLDVMRLRELLASLDDSALYADDLIIDTSRYSRLRRPSRSRRTSLAQLTSCETRRRRVWPHRTTRRASARRPCRPGVP